ncbi:MAG: Eukaryotic peptide chain release factor GTP-binding subunit [Paramarteilia canceri]
MADPFFNPTFNISAPEFVPVGKDVNEAKSNNQIDKKLKNDLKIQPKSKVSQITNPEIAIPSGRKESVSLVIIGHVDAGKSTISGHIMYLKGLVDERTMEDYKREAQRRKMDSWYLTYALDTCDEEREKGKTVQCGHARFSTSTRDYFLCDAPGHQGYIREMINGASYADIAILIVSARSGEFESGFERGGQTKEHSLIVRNFGAQKMIVYVSKMDCIKYEQARYDHIVGKVKSYLKTLGFDPEKDVLFLPGSGYYGKNIVGPMEECPWYTGLPLLPLLDSLALDSRDVEGPTRIILTGKEKDFNKMTFPAKVLVGAVAPGYVLLSMPDNVLLKMEKITLETDDDQKTDSIAIAGENITIQVSVHSDSINKINIDKISDGSILCDPLKPVNMCKKFFARIRLFSGEIMLPGFTCMMHLLNETRELTFDRVLKFENKSTKEKYNADRKFVRPKEVAYVRFSVKEPIALEEYSSFPNLARFNLRKNEQTIGIGRVEKIPKSEKGESNE